MSDTKLCPNCHETVISAKRYRCKRCMRVKKNSYAKEKYEKFKATGLTWRIIERTPVAELEKFLNRNGGS